MGFSQKHINLVASPSGSNVNVRKEPTTNSTVLYNRSNTATPGTVASAGRTTGDFVKEGSYTWFKIILTKSYGGQSWGWVRNDVVKLYKPKTEQISEAKAKSLIDNLVQTDIQVYEQALKIAPLLDSAEKKGANVSKQKNLYKEIVQRLEARQEKMKNSKLLKWQTGIKKGTEKLKDFFKSFLATQYHIYGTESIGAIGTIIISAVIGGGLVVAAYFAFRPDYDESKTDLKMSTELEKALSLLTPIEAAKLQKDLEKQVDTAYNTGKSNERFNVLGGGLKWALIALVVGWGVTKGLNVYSSVKKVKK